MVINRFVPLTRVLEKVYTEAGYTHEFDWADAIEWTADVIDLIGVKVQYVPKVTNGTCAAPCDTPMPIKIESYRGELPCDLHKIIQVRDKSSRISLRYSGDSFFLYHDAPTQTNVYSQTSVNSTYTVNSNYIFTTFEKGELELSYLAFPTDENGLPMIPDDTKVIRAVKCYLIERTDYRLYRQNRITREIYENSKQELAWAMGSASNHLEMPSIDELESIKNQVLRLIPKVTQHSTGFRYLGVEERRINHNTK